jgi:hypothetical protein
LDSPAAIEGARLRPETGAGAQFAATVPLQRRHRTGTVLRLAMNLCRTRKGEELQIAQIERFSCLRNVPILLILIHINKHFHSFMIAPEKTKTLD